MVFVKGIYSLLSLFVFYFPYLYFSFIRILVFIHQCNRLLCTWMDSIYYIELSVFYGGVEIRTLLFYAFYVFALVTESCVLFMYVLSQGISTNAKNDSSNILCQMGELSTRTLIYHFFVKFVYGFNEQCVVISPCGR